MAQHRNSTIELLRIISMVMIVAQHYAIHGGFDWLPSDTNFSHYWYNLISIGGRAGVDIFVLITGFYLIDDKHTRIDIKRILKFWGEIFFYSIACFFIFTLAGKNDFSIKAVVESLFPILFSRPCQTINELKVNKINQNNACKIARKCLTCSQKPANNQAL